MSNSEHLKAVLAGRDAVEAWWNVRKLSIPELGMDLAGADLSNANLRSMPLVCANLIQANLAGCDMSFANLQHALLFKANLAGVNLEGADLRGVHIAGADFSNARFSINCFDMVDLSEAIGLETVNFALPCSITVDTIVKSKGRICRHFLEGCEVPDEFVTFIPSLIRSLQPIQFYSCFLSHSSSDQPFAEKLANRLRAERVNVFYAPEDMKAGRQFTAQIDEAIGRMDKLLLVLSPASAASGWVAHEIKRARAKEKQTGLDTFFPIGLASIKALEEWSLLDLKTGEDLADVVRSYHIPDFSNWQDEASFERAFQQLMRDLKAEGSVGDVKKGL